MAVQVIRTAGQILVEDTGSGHIATLDGSNSQTLAGWACVVIADPNASCDIKTTDTNPAPAARVNGPVPPATDPTITVYPNSNLGPREYYYGSYRRTLSTPTGNVGIRG